MFTLKFQKDTNENSTEFTSKQSAISCPNYSIYRRANGHVTITTYPTMIDVDGVERQLMPKDGIPCSEYVSYDSCFIENDKGKTIEHINCKKL